MEAETNYTYQDYMNDNNVVVTDLSEKAQRLIAKFNATEDEDTLDSLEKDILDHVENFIEGRDKKNKEAERKAKFEAAKKEKLEAQKNKTTVKVDVSKAPTVKVDESDKAKKGESVIDILFGK